MPTEPTLPTPQDAPVGQPWPNTQWQAGPSTAGQAPRTPTAATPTPSVPAEPGPQRRVIPAPTGPNWALAIVGVLLMLGAGAAVAYLQGYRPDGSFQLGPATLIGVGAILVAVGIVGSLIRSSSCRHRR
ncbi:MAG: hypothetical protein ACOYBY_12205 [Dermatophilaceae bacterium]